MTGQCYCLASWTGDKCDVNNDTTVWALAKVVGEQMNDMIAQDQHRIFAR